MSPISAPPAVTTKTPGRVATLWAEAAAPATGRRVPGTVPVGVLAAVIALLASAYLVPNGFSVAYSDAQSHLTIARRLFDTRSNPGLAQLGTVWLPAPHLLLAPFVFSLGAWHTGWGAAFLGAGCLGISAAALYRAAARWGAGRLGRLLTVAALVINPTMLYLTSTALTEPVLIATMSCTLAGLATFTTRKRLSSPGELAIFAGLPAALAVLSRYEGWALAFTGTVFVAVVAWRRTNGSIVHTTASMTGFVLPPLLAMGWWVAYNWVVFHDPLEFLFGEYSANAQQTEIVASGTTTKGNLITTLNTLNLAVGSSVGWALLVLAGIGLLAALTVLRARNRLLFLVTSASSYLFLVVALYAGQAVIWNQAINASYIWNNRFGMASIIPAALLAGIAAEAAGQLLQRHPAGRRWRLLPATVATGMVIVLIGQAGWFLQDPTVRSLVMTEMAESISNTADSRQAATWLNAHYDGGNILIDETTWSNAVLPMIGIPLQQFYLRADDAYFTEAVADPAAHVRWVWASRDATDPVTTLTKTAAFNQQFQQAFANDTITIYTRIGN
jgi:hypothetical protein